MKNKNLESPVQNFSRIPRQQQRREPRAGPFLRRCVRPTPRMSALGPKPCMNWTAGPHRSAQVKWGQGEEARMQEGGDRARGEDREERDRCHGRRLANSDRETRVGGATRAQQTAAQAVSVLPSWAPGPACVGVTFTQGGGRGAGAESSPRPSLRHMRQTRGPRKQRRGLRQKSWVQTPVLLGTSKSQNLCPLAPLSMQDGKTSVTQCMRVTRCKGRQGPYPLSRPSPGCPPPHH